MGILRQIQLDIRSRRCYGRWDAPNDTSQNITPEDVYELSLRKQRKLISEIKERDEHATEDKAN